MYSGDKYDLSDGDITLMGKVLAHLPLDVRLGKLIYLGNAFGVAEECIIMGKYYDIEFFAVTWTKRRMLLISTLLLFFLNSVCFGNKKSIQLAVRKNS